MMLRRVIGHLRKQEWTAIGLDFIIVVSVFIGLQVQEWSGQRDDRRREMQIVADLLADLDIDRAQYPNGLVTAVHRVSAPELAASIRIMATFVICHHGDTARADAHAAGLQACLKGYQEKLE